MNSFKGNDRQSKNKNSHLGFKKMIFLLYY